MPRCIYATFCSMKLSRGLERLSTTRDLMVNGSTTPPTFRVVGF